MVIFPRVQLLGCCFKVNIFELHVKREDVPAMRAAAKTAKAAVD
jgi:hypothetical protein